MTLGRVLRAEVIPDGQAGEVVLEMHDQRLAGKDLQSRRRIKIAARPLPVRRRAADHLVVEKEKVLDRRCYRIERGPTLPRGEPHFEDAFLARQRHRLSELRSNRAIRSSLGRLRPGSRSETFKQHHEREGTEC